MKIEDHRYQRDRKHQTSGDAPSELVPDRIERDFLAKPLVLDITAVEIIGQDRHKGANHQLKHGAYRLLCVACALLQRRFEVAREPTSLPAPLRHWYPVQRPLFFQPTPQCCAAGCQNQECRSKPGTILPPRTSVC